MSLIFALLSHCSKLVLSHFWDNALSLSEWDQLAICPFTRCWAFAFAYAGFCPIPNNTCGAMTLFSGRERRTPLTGSTEVGRRYFPDGTWESTHSMFTGRSGYIFIGKGTIFEQRNENLNLDKDMGNFAHVLSFAHQHKIETRLFITPQHVFMIDLWWRLGYSEMWHEFHRRLVEVNDAVAIEMGREPFPVFGFGHLRGVVDEPIGSAHESAHSMFTDGAHFRPQLGEQIMAAVWTDGAGLGARLDVNSVDFYLSQVEQLRYAFESANTELTAALRREISPELE